MSIDFRSSIKPVQSYRPPVSEVDPRLRDLLNERPLPGDKRFGCYRLTDSSPYADVARAVECSVFQEFFGNDPEVMTEAYAPYEAHSTFLLVVDRELQRPAGALRIISHSENGLKTLNDIAREPLSISVPQAVDYHGLDLEKCWDVGTLAVLKPYRGQATDHLVTMMLYGLFYTAACKSKIDHIVTVLDKHAYSQLTEKLMLPFEPIAGSEPFNYLGSESSRAAYLNVPQTFPKVAASLSDPKKKAPRLLEAYMALLCGDGLPKVVEVND